MKIELATVIHAPVEQVWREVQTPRLLAYVARPLLRFYPIAPSAWPERYESDRHIAGLRLFGWLPVGRQWICISRPETVQQGEYRLLDEGRGTFLRRWEHLIVVTSRADERTDYRDKIVIEAGPVTPIVAAVVWLLFHHRQRRWRKLARHGFRYE